MTSERKLVEAIRNEDVADIKVDGKDTNKEVKAIGSKISSKFLDLHSGASGD